MKIKHLKNSIWTKDFQGSFSQGQISDLDEKTAMIIVNAGYAEIITKDENVKDTKAPEIEETKVVEPTYKKKVVQYKKKK